MFARDNRGFMGRPRPRPDRGQSAGVVSLPAPVGGWNARDALAAMPETDAVRLVNWFPTPSDCVVRAGYSNWSTGYPAAVETLAVYEGSSTERLFACSNGAIYDATASGPVGAAMVSGLLSNRWQHTNFTTTAGARWLVMANGADTVRGYDGAAWSAPAITGVAPAELANVCAHKSRLWFLRRNSLEAWYLPVGVVAGAAVLFTLGPVFQNGGSLLAAQTWSVDTGAGLDDLLAFVTDQGEVAVYQGTDPTSAATWSLIGVYRIGSAIGRRCLQKYGGDVLVISQEGLLPLSRLLQSAVVNVAATLTDKIQFAISEAVSAYSANLGWETAFFPKENMLLLNVPISSTDAEQYVMNTVTGAWCRFTGWSARCWETWNDHVYFGGATFVAKAWDQADDAGVGIATDLKTAFSYMGRRGQLKQWTMVRPIVTSDGNPGITYGLNVDFDDSDVAGTPSFVPSSAGSWDVSVWDSGIWAGGAAVQKSWQFLSGLGYCGAFRMRTLSRGVSVRLSAIDYLWKPAGVL